MQDSDHPRKRDEQNGGGHQVGQKDRDSELLAKLAAQPRQAVPGGNRQRQGDDYHRGPDEESIRHPPSKQGIEKENPQMFEGGRLMIDKRIVVRIQQIVGLLERGDQHPREWKSREGRKGGEDSKVHASRAPSLEPLGERHLRSPRRAGRPATRRSRWRRAEERGTERSPPHRRDPLPRFR